MRLIAPSPGLTRNIERAGRGCECISGPPSQQISFSKPALAASQESPGVPYQR
jgi:hypothetical protein